MGKLLDLQAFKLRREHERLWSLATIEDLISELDQIAERVRALESAARSEVERMGHWRRLALLGERRAEYCKRRRRLGGGL